MIWFLHGNLGSPADWRPVTRILESGGHECRVINLWKYLECCPKSLADMGRIICSEIQTQDPTPALCGYSLGGRLAMTAMLEEPQLWKSVIFVSTNPGLKTEEERRLRRISDAEWASKCLSLPWPRFLEEWDGQEVLSAWRPQGEDSRLALLLWKRSIARAFIDWSLGVQPDYRKLLQGCRTPVLWIAGEQDMRFAAMAREIVGNHVKTIPGCGHRIPMQCPSELAALIDSFILPGCHAR